MRVSQVIDNIDKLEQRICSLTKVIKYLGGDRDFLSDKQTLEDIKDEYTAEVKTLKHALCDIEVDVKTSTIITPVTSDSTQTDNPTHAETPTQTGDDKDGILQDEDPKHSSVITQTDATYTDAGTQYEPPVISTKPHKVTHNVGVGTVDSGC